MTTPVRNILKRLAALLTLGGLAIIVAAVAYVYLTPKRYESSVRVKLEMRGVDQGESNIRSAVASEFSAKTGECAYLNSDPFLNQVIEHLVLRNVWGSTNAPLETNETLRVFRSKVRIEPVPDASLIRIRVTGADREETARLANGVARLYFDDRQERNQALKLEKLRAYQDRWEEENKKVIAAQNALARMAHSINQNRSTNVVRVIDGQSLADLRFKSVELESEYVRQQSLSGQLKKMDSGQLRQILPGVVTNGLLEKLLSRESAAEHDLTDVRLGHGPDGLDEKHATLLVNELNKEINEAIAGAMQAREAGMVALKSEIDSLRQILAGATTNADAPAEPPEFSQARQEVDRLRLERDSLPEPAGEISLVAEIVDVADPPVHPVSPSRNLARGLGLGGGVAVVFGLFLQFVAGRTRKKAASGGSESRL